MMPSDAVGGILLSLLAVSIIWLMLMAIKWFVRLLKKPHQDNLCPPLRFADPSHPHTVAHQQSPTPYALKITPDSTQHSRRIPPVTQPPADRAMFDFDLVPSVNENGFGYVIKRLDDELLLSWEGLPVRNGFESFPVAGESYHMQDLQSDSFHPPSRLALIPEPTNRHDPNALAIYDISGRHQAGYIPKEEAKRITNKIKKGVVRECRAMWEIFKGGKRVSLRVLVVYDGARIRLPVVD